MTQPSVGANVYQSTNVRVHLSTQITFHSVLFVDGFSNATNLLFTQITRSGIILDPDLFDDAVRYFRPDAVNVT
jgi:hypothetical protein